LGAAIAAKTARNQQQVTKHPPQQRTHWVAAKSKMTKTIIMQSKRRNGKRAIDMSRGNV